MKSEHRLVSGWKGEAAILESKERNNIKKLSNSEEHLAVSQKLNRLIYMAHEIRAPLNSIIGATDILREKQFEGEDKKLLDMAHASGELLLSIINNFLDLSRMDADGIGLENAPFSLSEQIQICLSMMEIRAKEKNITLTSLIEEPCCDIVVGDPYRLRQIIINLLTNAVKFSENGNVSLNARMIADENPDLGKIKLLFSVSDQGIGIQEHQKDSIFEFFKQADESINRRFGGTGLGLSISKKLVEMMGGEIWFESIAGSGSTFHFTVSLSPAPASAKDSFFFNPINP